MQSVLSLMTQGRVLDFNKRLQQKSGSSWDVAVHTHSENIMDWPHRQENGSDMNKQIGETSEYDWEEKIWVLSTSYQKLTLLWTASDHIVVGKREPDTRKLDVNHRIFALQQVQYKYPLWSVKSKTNRHSEKKNMLYYFKKYSIST